MPCIVELYGYQVEIDIRQHIFSGDIYICRIPQGIAFAFVHSLFGRVAHAFAAAFDLHYMDVAVSGGDNIYFVLSGSPVTLHDYVAVAGEVVGGHLFVTESDVVSEVAICQGFTCIESPLNLMPTAPSGWFRSGKHAGCVAR